MTTIVMERSRVRKIFLFFVIFHVVILVYEFLAQIGPPPNYCFSKLLFVRQLFDIVQRSIKLLLKKVVFYLVKLYYRPIVPLNIVFSSLHGHSSPLHPSGRQHLNL
uniref:Transmembrane protein n=1 Tax=Parascaris equorum TaxID=6256 RepID=A0A914RG40_PAREQ